MSSTRSSAQEAEIPGRPGDSGEEVSDSTSEGVEPPITISAWYSECLSRFNLLIALMQNTVAGSEIQELGSRLQIWAGNHGAHRSHSDRLSLDYRLREALELHQEVGDHFKDLIQAIDDAIITISGEDKTNIPDLSYDSSSGSESSLTSSQKAVIGDPTLHRAQSSSLAMQNTVQTIEDIITSLYKFSITIQNPAHRDRTARAAKINISFWSQFDLRHIQDKFPKCSNERLIRNLAQANTKRRQLFAYHKRHQQKIQHLPESSPQDGTDISTGQLEDVLDQKVSADSMPRHPGTSTVNTGNTRLTQTTVSTIRPPLVKIAVSVSERSQRTNISNGPLSTSQKLLTIPPPPDVAWDFEVPFICPYCYLFIDPKDQRHWETHVLDDLRPYICTFGDCVSAAILYDRFSEWKAHELEVHRREWFCNSCKVTYDTREDFTEHINLRHKSLIEDDDQLAPLLLLCERTSTRDEGCPLCANFAGKVHSLQEHLAVHLRQLALYTLPKVSVDDTENDLAESDVVAQANFDSSSDNTSQGLRNLSDEKFEDFLKTGWFTPPDSPFQPAVESDTSISWDFCRIPLATLENKSKGSDYQKLVPSFGGKDGQQNKIDVLIEVETITFLISRFSLLIAAVDNYKKLFERLEKWYRFRRSFISFIDVIDIQNSLFLATIESLMRYLDVPESELQSMIKGTRESDKYWIENPLLMKERLGPIYPAFSSALHAMREPMEGILDMLYLNRDGSIIWARARSANLDLQLHEIRRLFAKKEEILSKMLKTRNRMFRDLLCGLELSAAKERKKTLAMGNPLIARRTEIVNIHGLLIQALNCSCSGGHMFAIESFPLPALDNNLEYKLLVSTSASPNRVLKVKIYEVSDKEKTEQVQVVESLCLALASWEDDHSTAFPYALGSLSGSCEARYVIGTNEAFQLFPTYSLLELLRGRPVHLTRKSRFGLATSVASTCLRLGSTPWVPKTGMSKDNIIFYGEGLKIYFKESYLAPGFTPIPTTTPNIETQPGSSSMNNAQTRRDLECLGILLLELCFGQAIEDCPFWTKYLIDGIPHTYTKFMAAGEWLQVVSMEAGPKMEDVIEYCLLGRFKESPDWGSAAFVQEVFEKVVEPLSVVEGHMNVL
ncbi:hypothetical protein IFR05_012220 [Cadophora sp. M221]|nr:hypothetical protein IFR05_012220 [Cadophora sp. M221]